MAVVYTLSGTEGTELPDVITVNTVFVLSAHRFVWYFILAFRLICLFLLFCFFCQFIEISQSKALQVCTADHLTKKVDVFYS